MEHQAHGDGLTRTRRRKARGIAIGAGAILLLIALMSTITVSADVPDNTAMDDVSNAKVNRDVLEGIDATRYAQPPPPTAPPGILGVYYPFYQLHPTAGTFPSPTPPPFSGVQDDHSYQRNNDRG